MTTHITLKSVVTHVKDVLYDITKKIPRLGKNKQNNVKKSKNEQLLG